MPFLQRQSNWVKFVSPLSAPLQSGPASKSKIIREHDPYNVFAARTDAHYCPASPVIRGMSAKIEPKGVIIMGRSVIVLVAIITMGTAVHATTLASGAIFGGPTQTFAVCYLYNAGNSAVTANSLSAQTEQRFGEHLRCDPEILERC